MNYFKGYESIWLPYTQMKTVLYQLPVVKTKGVKIFLKDGRELIDGIASWWSVAHGYNHPYLIKNLTRQAKILPHIMLAGLANEQTYNLSYNLTKITPKGLNKVFFSDSGSTAVEVAMKMSIQYFLNKKEFKKIKFVSFKNSYHGDTCGAMSLSDLDSGMHKKFKSFLNKNYNLKLPKDKNELNEFEDFVKEKKSNISAVIMEPMVQCAGNMQFHSKDILREIYNITKKYELLFIADECATGFFRTGEYFACNHANITPDILVVGKALTGGYMTLAATLATNEIYDAFLSDDLNDAFMHGPTFMGNALSCSLANASIELFNKENYKLKVQNIDKILNKELKKVKKLSKVKDIRILGAIAAIEIETNWEEIFLMRELFIEKLVWLRPFGNVIYIMPSLTIKKNELIKITNSIYEILNENLKR